jgi:hypothetical protein
MNFKNIVLASFVAMAGFVGMAKADGYFTTRSTGVLITSGTNIEVTSIQIGTGSTVLGGVWAVLVDSNPLTGASSGAGSNLVYETFNLSRFPESQWMHAPLVAFSTNVTGVPYNSYNFVNATGEGRAVENGLSLFIVNNASNGSNPGVTVTVGYRKKK